MQGIRLKLASLVALLCLSGCANHVRYLDEQDVEVRSQLHERRLAIGGPESVVRDPHVQVQLEQVDRYEDRTQRTTTRYEEFTPYQGVRELYEVPAGLVSLPLSLTVHVLRVALFLYIPQQPVNDYADFTLAALNPALNVENPRRIERREDEVVAADTSFEERVERTPLVNRWVSVRMDASEPFDRYTDRHGNLSIHLLDLLRADSGMRPRKLTLAVEGESGRVPGITHEFFIERDLGIRLGRARRWVLDPREAPGTVASLSQAIYALDRLGFEEYSLVLEDEISSLYRTNPEFLVDFQAAIQHLYEIDAPLGDSADVGAAGPAN